MNIYLIYGIISLIFSSVLYFDNQISGNEFKIGYYVKNSLINFVILYFINPLRFITKETPHLNFNTVNPFN